MKLTNLLFCGLFVTASLSSRGLSAMAPLLQSEVISVVLRENPSIRAARANWEAMKKRVPQARAWEDTMAGVDLERRGTTRFDTFSDAEWMIAQEIPISGKNLSRGRTATAEAEQSFEELRRAVLDVISRARGAYFRLANGHAQLAINRENSDLLTQFAEISRVKYEAGRQTQSDVLLAETEVAKLLQTRADLEREVSDQETALNVLMNRPAQAPLAHPTGLSFEPLRMSAEEIRELALARRPEIARAQKAVEAEQGRVQLARRQWFPDPRVRVEARQFNGANGIQEYDTGIFFNVPWGNFAKYSAGVSEARNTLQKSRLDLEAARSEVLGLVRDQLKKIETAARNYELFQNKIVPLARQTVESTRAGYVADKTGFLELITARRNLQDAQSAALDHLAEHQVAIAELRAIIGVDPAATIEGGVAAKTSANLSK
jgi:outer membrane protein, heavy metal efflux system